MSDCTIYSKDCTNIVSSSTDVVGFFPPDYVAPTTTVGTCTHTIANGRNSV